MRHGYVEIKWAFELYMHVRCIHERGVTMKELILNLNI